GRRASTSADGVAAEELEVAESWGLAFTSLERDDGVRVCYDGAAFRQALTMAPSPDAAATAALALPDPACAPPGAGAAAAPAPAAADDLALTLTPRGAGETCAAVTPKQGAASPPSCTHGQVWAASFRIAPDRASATLAVEPIAGWLELWMFRRGGDGGWM